MSELEVYETAEQSVTLFRTDDPAEVVQRAAQTAAPLAEVIDKQGLSVAISGRKHVRVEGWTLLGTMLGVYPVCEWSRPTEDGNGWEAHVEARTRDGALVGAAEAMCHRSESAWARRDEYALRSMAQTRATSKALRQPLGFVMTLAGYEATPAEEMDAAPANQPPASPSTPGAAPRDDRATEAQLKLLHVLIGKLVSEHGQVEATIKDAIYAEHGVTSTKELTKDECSREISRVKLLAEPTTSDDVPF